MDPVSDAIAVSLCGLFEAMEETDCRVGLLLLHPEDVRALARNPGSGFVRSRRSARPEWGGRLVGDLWGACVIETDTVEQGGPLALPDSAARLSEMNAVGRHAVPGLRRALRSLRGRVRRLEGPARFGLSRRGYL